MRSPDYVSPPPVSDQWCPNCQQSVTPKFRPDPSAALIPVVVWLGEGWLFGGAPEYAVHRLVVMGASVVIAVILAVRSGTRHCPRCGTRDLETMPPDEPSHHRSVGFRH